MRWLAALAVLLWGCAPAPVSPEHAERQRIFETAIEPCKRQHPSIREIEFHDDGSVSAVTRSSTTDLEAFKRCVDVALAKVAEKRPYGAGRLAAKAEPASISYLLRGSMILVPVVLNDVEATLLLDTGASVTIVRSEVARRAGMQVALTAPRMSVRVAGGETFSVPYVKAKALRVGEAAVEGLDIGVSDSLARGLPLQLDGVLGTNFLNHFRVTIDRTGRTLTLDPVVAHPRQRLNRDSRL
jgi:aspartyl protease